MEKAKNHEILLTFHRLKKKAKNHEIIKFCQLHEKAKNKDILATSTKNMKFANLKKNNQKP